MKKILNDPETEKRNPAGFFICLCTSVLLASLLICALPTKGEEDIYDRFIRLHVLANSDSEDDQALKLRVRDAVISYLSDISDVRTLSAADAEERYLSVLPEIEKTAASVIADAGCDYACHVTLTQEVYPARSYEAYTLPAGTYRSLRVLIGAAEGHNWFCVLFPPMCLSLATEYKETNAASLPSEAVSVSPDSDELLRSAGFTPYEVSLLSEKSACVKTVVRFRIVEFFKKMFRK